MRVLKWCRKVPIELWLLTIAAFFTRFLFIGFPHEVVFDEVHFGKFISAYFTHTPYFDIHPPAGKLIYAGIAWLFNFTPGFTFETIGQAYINVPITALRSFPALLGALLIPLVYLLLRKLSISRIAATLAAGLVLFDTALLTHSRFILLDIPLVFFGFLSIFLVLSGNESEKIKAKIIYFISAAFSFGLAVSLKWTSCAFIVPIALFIFHAFKEKKINKSLFFVTTSAFIFIPILVYIGFFALHFSLTAPPKLTNFTHSFVAIHQEMFSSNLQNLSHPYESKWWQWPLLSRSIYYWVAHEGTQETRWIYLLGNPFIWWSSFVVLLSTILLFFLDLKKSLFDYPYKPLLAGYLASFIPFVFISRAMFLYHYLPALIFSFLIFAIAIDRMVTQSSIKKRVVIVFIVLAFLFFLYFAPLSYGMHLSEQSFRQHRWLSGWR